MEEDDLDTRSRVLQTTLAQISSFRQYNDGAEDEECCVICMEAVSDKAVAQPCKHDNFDFLCLVSWFQERSTCPLCQADVKTVQYQFADNGAFKTYEVPKAPQLSGTHGSLSEPGLYFAGRGRPSHTSTRYIPRPRFTLGDEAQRRRSLHTSRSLPTPDEAIQRRRHIYGSKLYSLHVGSNRVSRFREFTTQLFNSDQDLISRARTFMRRELQVFEFLNPNNSPGSSDRRANNAEFLLEYIVAILKTVDIQSSGGQAEDLIQEFLGRDNTRLFLHELRAWLRSPYISLEDWDRHVQYNESGKEHTQSESELGRRDDASRGRYRGPRGTRGSSRSRGDRYTPYQHRRPRLDD
ncbi:putative RING finger [Hyphodiscus hymeniophilus]|uniref:RING-type E3 ubiquitin transferase n=1 Tax=Hyphodiscus hymeniophilus TaxID=353542 RepID=A0A9P7AVF4_9HELO|nr:putative RING finger [Hyphodiscus hymeniophilus]